MTKRQLGIEFNTLDFYFLATRNSECLGLLLTSDFAVYKFSQKLARTELDPPFQPTCEKDQIELLQYQLDEALKKVDTESKIVLDKERQIRDDKRTIERHEGNLRLLKGTLKDYQESLSKREDDCRNLEKECDQQ